MKKILFFIVALMTIGATTITAQNYNRSGNTFTSSKGVNKQDVNKTKFTWKDSKGKEYPIYISNTGSCFIIRTSSKSGKEYKSYLGSEISQQICKELGVEYKKK